MKKKMLILNDTVFSGGVEKLMYDLVMRWYKDYDITILTEYGSKSFYNEYPKEVKSLTYGTRISLKNVKGLRKYNDMFCEYMLDKKFKKINKGNYDYVLAMKEGIITALGQKLDAKVKLAWVHLDYKNAYWTRAAFVSANDEVSCMKNYKNIICVSRFIMETIKERIGDPGNLVVRYNPIDEKLILKKSMETVDDLWDKESKIRFLSVGRLHYQKGYDLLVKACSLLNYEGYKERFEVVVIGEGEMEADLKKQCVAQDVDNISFIGYRDNPYKYFRDADWFISSSRYEGYSLVSQEAAILDVPVMATNVSGVPELLGDNFEYGIVIKDISAQEIAANMKKVIDDPSLQEKYKDLIMQRKAIINFDDRIKAITRLFDESYNPEE